MPRNDLISSVRLAAVLLVVPIVSARAQSTGTPVYQAPYRAFVHSELALSISDPGAGTAFEGSYRTGFSSNTDIGFRVGLHDYHGCCNTNLLVGGDLRARVLTHDNSFPLDGSFTAGVGIESGHGVTVGRVPLGFSMGRRLHAERGSLSLVPYVQPVLSILFGDASGTEFSLGLGLDARVSPRLDLRFSAALGDQSGVGFTIAFIR
jgi:hypothetical protein